MLKQFFLYVSIVGCVLLAAHSYVALVLRSSDGALSVLTPIKRVLAVVVRIGLPILYLYGACLLGDYKHAVLSKHMMLGMILSGFYVTTWILLLRKIR